MASYPYQPVYYPPQPIVAPPPQPVIYAGAPQPTVVHTTTVVHKKGYGGSKSYSDKKYRKAPSSKKSTFNLLTINKNAPKASSSKKPSSKKSSSKKSSSSSSKIKVPKVPKPSFSSDKKKKTHRGKSKKGRARPRKPKSGTIADMLGPQLKMQMSDKYTLRALMNKINELERGADSAVRRFAHALFALCRDHGGVLPACIDVPLEVQYMVSRAIYSRNKRPMTLTFTNETGDVFESEPARPQVDSERVASVAFMMPDGTKTTLNGRYSFELRFGERTFVYSGEFTEHSRTIHGDGEAFHWMINLYDSAHGGNYHKYMVPLPTIELTMMRSRVEENVYIISKAVLVVDFEPRKHFFSLPTKASDLVQVPALLPRPHMPYKAYMRDNVALQRRLHAEIEARLAELMADSPNKWAFRCSVGARAEQSEADHRVFLGTVSEEAVAYAVMTMLADKNLLERVNDPEFAKEVLAEDENGRRAIEVVAMLYDKYHAAMGKTRTYAHQDFPSVLQLLAHTSGLPASRSLRCDQVRAYYLKVTNVLSGSEEPSPVEMSYDKRELAVLEEFSNAPGADNDADVSVGPAHNTFEAFLLAMFIRRFAAASPMAARTPGDIINAYIRPSDYKLNWGTSLTGVSAAPILADPLVFASCATSTFSGLVSRARMLTEELAQPSRANSVFFRMLSVHYPVVGENADVVHSVGWMQRRANEKVDVLFAGSTNDFVDDVVMIVVPQLNYFIVFHEMSSDFERPLQTSVRDVVKAVVKALNADGVREQYESIPDRVRLDISAPSRANKAWDTSFLSDLPDDFVVGGALPDAGVEFVDPFVVQMQQRLRSVHFVREDDSGVLASLEFSTGEHVPLVYDPRRNGYFVRLFDDESALGPEVVVTDEYIQHDGRIYIRKSDFDEFSRRYLAAYDTAMKLANADVFRTKQTNAVRAGTLVAVTPATAFSLESKIGYNAGTAILGGVAAGATAAALAPYTWGTIGPGYPYGYPYYPPGVYAPGIYASPYRPLWLGPRGYYRRPFRHPRRFRR